MRNVSNAKEEKVVKPPRNPVVSATRCSGGSEVPRSIAAASAPIATEPATFTASVAHGKAAPAARPSQTPRR
jgi:hypothetical protein